MERGNPLYQQEEADWTKITNSDKPSHRDGHVTVFVLSSRFRTETAVAAAAGESPQVAHKTRKTLITSTDMQMDTLLFRVTAGPPSLVAHS